MKKLIIALIMSLAIVGLAHAGPECKTYSYYTELGERWTMEFFCGSQDSGIGIVYLYNDDELLATRLYFYFVDSKTKINIVAIPGVADLFVVDGNLEYPEWGMIFYLEGNEK